MTFGRSEFDSHRTGVLRLPEIEEGGKLTTEVCLSVGEEAHVFDEDSTVPVLGEVVFLLFDLNGRRWFGDG